MALPAAYILHSRIRNTPRQGGVITLQWKDREWHAPSSARAPSAGEPFGDYLLLQLLGRGGMGSVYEAQQIQTGDLVAIKVLDSHMCQDAKSVKRFENEAHAVMQIDHPNVIKIFDYGCLEDGTLYQVMELLEGQSLACLMESKGRFSPLEVLPYLHQICIALQAAHDRSVVHRDLKPENIFVLEERPLALKLLDFGVAKLLSTRDLLDLTATGMIVGTPTFIAPEQVIGDKHKVGPQSDIYSLGVILYNMLCGSLPFETEGIGVMLIMHLKDQPQPLRQRAPDLPEEVSRVVHHCLEKDPSQRPANAMEVIDAYEAALNAAAPATLLAESNGRSAGPQLSDLETVVAPEPPGDPQEEVTVPRFPWDLHDAPTQVNTPIIDRFTPLQEPAGRPRSSRRVRTRLVIGAAVLITLLIAVGLALLVSSL